MNDKLIFISHWTQFFFLNIYLPTQGGADYNNMAMSLHTCLQRNGKSYRLKWINYLRYGLKHDVILLQEEQLIIHLHSLPGNPFSFLSIPTPLLFVVINS